MKQQKILITTLTLLAVLFIAACTPQVTGETYNVTIEKPTPCHDIRVDEVSTNEGYEIRIYIEDPTIDGVCAQVITPQQVTGEVSGEIYQIIKYR